MGWHGGWKTRNGWGYWTILELFKFKGQAKNSSNSQLLIQKNQWLIKQISIYASNLGPVVDEIRKFRISHPGIVNLSQIWLIGRVDRTA